KQGRDVFPVQAPRDGPHEAVDPRPFLFLLLGFLFLDSRCRLVQFVWMLSTKLGAPCMVIEKYCLKYAKPEDIGASPEEESSDEEPSENEYDSSDEQMLGKPDP
ncbi:hypothetical protein BHE74_00054696, partial [Ensete ventricosum]